MPAPAGLAPFACKPDDSRGRRYAEPESETRTPFQRDRDRIIHCAAFRRLKYKTQVFVYHEGDNYRTRLTHSLEVSQIARSICRVLALNEDLAEALALGHDLGHTPFGHAGEDALDKAMRPFGGFDHNTQTLRILTELEQRYAEFDGLNLTWETLEGMVKHNGPLLSEPLAAPLAAQVGQSGVPAAILSYIAEHDLEIHTHPSAEAQVVALADDIAYNNHDIDDGLRARLFTIDDLDEVPLVGPVFQEVRERYPGLERPRVIHESVRRLIDRMVTDLIGETQRRLAKARPDSSQAVREWRRPLVAYTEGMKANDSALKEFLRQNMYDHYKVKRMTSKAGRVVTELFDLFLAEPECLPSEWRARAEGAGTSRSARLVADFIAGMTDRFAMEEHSRLFEIHTKT